MRVAVLLSFFLYLVAFFVLQQFIGASHRARTASAQRIDWLTFMLPVCQFFALNLVLLGLVTMKHWTFDNLQWVRLTGFAVVGIGLFISMWSQHELGANWSGHIGVHQNHRLITTGPYRWVRNPLYSGMWVSGIGICLVSLNVLYGLGALIWALAFSTRIPGEEAVLRERFKRRYERYAAHTGRLVPRLRR